MLVREWSVFDKVGVNFSAFRRQITCSCNKYSPRFTGAELPSNGRFCGFTSKNPNVPTVHLNVRLFVAFKKALIQWWFGGGFDMTPYYGYEEDAIHWHKTATICVNLMVKNIYEEYKKL